jgi:hypothetical protein
MLLLKFQWRLFMHHTHFPRCTHNTPQYITSLYVKYINISEELKTASSTALDISKTNK